MTGTTSSNTLHKSLAVFRENQGVVSGMEPVWSIASCGGCNRVVEVTAPLWRIDEQVPANDLVPGVVCRGVRAEALQLGVDPRSQQGVEAPGPEPGRFSCCVELGCCFIFEPTS